MTARSFVNKIPVRYTQPLGDLYRYLRELFNMPLDYLFDSFKYGWYSATFRPARSQRTLQGPIIKLYYGVEVGLTCHHVIS
ncbi:hypothetical protein A2V82_05795 [candidate division KSB1 bacterium RBG_16_48_16]|nr:MAG: hypothetical protein A2V82_05795 [candidate division KSB1 bacterium RBG_16_48_16]